MTTAAPLALQLLARAPAPDCQGSHEPVFFRLTRPEDRNRLQELLANDPALVVHDVIAGQLESLMRSRHPGRTLDAGGLAALLREHLGQTPEEEYGVWVFYPWARRVVHLLDEAEFVELRTNRNLYKITPDEQLALGQKRIGVVGLSVGQAVAMTLAMERSCGELRLADFDRLELTNLNRMRTGTHNLGLSKAVIAAREIAELDPYLRVRPFPEGVTAGNLDTFLMGDGKVSLLIEECDSLDMKVLCRQRAKELGIPVVMETSDRGMLDVERFDLEPGRPIFHGYFRDLKAERLRDLTNEEKIPLALSILGIETLSPRMRASLLEVGQTLETWPQPATAVVLGAAIAADVSRRILLGTFRESGRYFLDLDDLLADRTRRGAVGGTTREATPPKEEHQATRLDVEELIATTDRLALGERPGRVKPDHAAITSLVRAATMAPSGGNVQPWRWLHREGQLHLFHDRERSANFLDFEDRASHMTLGAAAENLVLQAETFRLGVDVHRFPLHPDLRLVCSFSFHQAEMGRPESEVPFDRLRLASAITGRETNRRVVRRRPIPDEQLAALAAIVRTVPGAELHLVDSEDELAELGEIVGAIERLRMLHPRCHADFVKEVRWTHAEAVASGDGIDLATLELTPWQRSGLHVARSWAAVRCIKGWGGGSAFEAWARRAITTASAVGLVTMPGIGPSDFFEGGRAVERVWLEARCRGIAFQPMTPITFLFARLRQGRDEELSREMAEELPRLRARFLRAYPQVSGRGEIFLFRVFLAEAPSTRSLRRPLEDVLVTEPSLAGSSTRLL